ncbi:HCLS1-associated protein X-1 isoform X2 [Emydura macquarii macquarii]|uniref:HCLS1-associated protein X-1 isoform X2 n=1 Tax=Emydura macquarii macquarii TaxID=1129001 RepID=UPI00352ACF29
MNLSELFRGFLGIPRGRRPRDPFFGGITRDEEDEDDEGPSRGARPPEDFGVGLGGMRFHRSFEELFCDVGQLLGQLEAWARPGQPVELPGPEAPRPGSGHLSEEEKRPALRDSMLKYPDSRRPRISPEGPDPGKELGDGAGLATPDRRPFAGLGEMQPASASPKEDKDHGGASDGAGQPGAQRDGRHPPQRGPDLRHHHQGGQGRQGLSGGGDQPGQWGSGAICRGLAAAGGAPHSRPGRPLLLPADLPPWLVLEPIALASLGASLGVPVCWRPAATREAPPGPGAVLDVLQASQSAALPSCPWGGRRVNAKE